MQGNTIQSALCSLVGIWEVSLDVIERELGDAMQKKGNGNTLGWTTRGGGKYKIHR